jgi:hypothetical protein
MPHAILTPAPATRSPNWLTRAGEEAAKRPLEVAASALAVTIAIGLASLHLMLNRYLMVFGQPGLSGFGQVANILPALAPVMALTTGGIILLIGLTVGSPIFTRYIFTGMDGHPLAEAFDWPNSDTPRWPAMRAYLFAHAPLLALAVYASLAFLSPSLHINVTCLAIVYGVAVLAPAAFAAWPNQPKFGARLKNGVLAAIASGLLSFFGLVWLSLIWTMMTPSSPSPQPMPWDARTWSVLIILLALMVHVMMTAFGAVPLARWAGLAAVAAFILVRVPGDQLLTFNALRLAGIGGGVANTYRDVGSDQVKIACLILATSDLRIVQLAANPSACDDGASRRTFITLRDASSAKKQKLLSDIRVFKLERFIDRSSKPAT